MNGKENIEIDVWASVISGCLGYTINTDNNSIIMNSAKGNKLRAEYIEDGRYFLFHGIVIEDSSAIERDQLIGLLSINSNKDKIMDFAIGAKDLNGAKSIQIESKWDVPEENWHALQLFIDFSFFSRIVDDLSKAISEKTLTPNGNKKDNIEQSPIGISQLNFA